MSEDQTNISGDAINISGDLANISGDRINISERSGRKKWGIIGAVLVVLIAVIAGISIYNTPENRLKRQLNLGNRYLEEQNYELAIMEFDKVIAIDPMNAEAYTGKAQAYEGMGDQAQALDTLQTGYEITEAEQLRGTLVSYLESYIEQLITKGRYDEAEALIEEHRDKVPGVDSQEYLDEIGELRAAAEWEELSAHIPPFDIADIKIMGYDLLEPRVLEIAEALGYSEIHYNSTELQDGVQEFINDDSISITQQVSANLALDAWIYSESESGSSLVIHRLYGEDTDASRIGMSRSNVPLAIGDSYEKWCDLIGIELIELLKASPHAGDGLVSYLEDTHVTSDRTNDVDMSARFSMYHIEVKNIENFSMTAYFLDGIVQSITYQFEWKKQ